MYKQLQIRKLVLEDLRRCEELYEHLSAINAALPKGSLALRKGYKYHSYRKNGKQFQKAVSDPQLINDLKLHQFLNRGLPYLKKRIDNNRTFLENDVFYDPYSIFLSMPAVYDMVENYNVYLKEDINPNKWIQENFQRNTRAFAYEHFTNNGVPVRSKAESMIGTALEYREWLFICEPKMNFHIEIKCPDFAVMMPKTRKVIYLEHFGKMGDLSYVKDTMDKLVLYSQYGLKLGDNFFFTWESDTQPLNEYDIKAVLDAMAAMDNQEEEKYNMLCADGTRISV